MIEYHSDHIEISLSVAAALLAFAGRDETRPHLGIGIDRGALCATDGYRLVRFELETATLVPSDGTLPDPSAHHGRVWSHAQVETLCKVARAHKVKSIALVFAECLPSAVFPPAEQILQSAPAAIHSREPVGVNPEYLGALGKVCKACSVDGVALTGVSDRSPLCFRVGGGEGLRAVALVMPMRV